MSTEYLKVGLALGGGAARGLAHVGIIQTLIAHDIPINCIAGTSFGALAGAAYCADTFDEFVKTVDGITLSSIPKLLSPTVSKSGFFSGKNVVQLINDVLGERLIEDLPIPFAAIAVDLDSGEAVQFTEGSLTEALRCSISIPVLFTPVQAKGSHFIDGGVVDPVPVEAVRALGADVVIAVDLFGSVDSAAAIDTQSSAYKADINKSDLGAFGSVWQNLFKGDKQTSFLGYANLLERTLAIAQHHATDSRLRVSPPDILIRPAMAHVGLFDFHRSQSIREIGSKAMELQISEVQAAIASKLPNP